jgi:hypothetical protein
MLIKKHTAQEKKETKFTFTIPLKLNSLKPSISHSTPRTKKKENAELENTER